MSGQSMSNDFLLPDVGEGLTEADLVAWRVAVGDTVKVNDIVCEIETAKSVVELPSPFAGVVQALLVAEGDTVDVGTPIIRIGDSAGAPAQSEPPSQPAAQAAVEGESPDLAPISAHDAASGMLGESRVEEQPLTLVGSGPKATAVARRPRRVASPSEAARVQAQSAFDVGAAAPEVVVEPEPEPIETATRADRSAARALAKPPVRKLAKDLGVDLSSIAPVREDGIITRDLVEAAASGLLDGARTRSQNGSGSAVSAAPRGPGADGARETREPIKGVRKMMGQAMVTSAFTAPHVTIWTTVDVTRTMELVERLRTHRDLRDVRISPLLVVAKACLLALRRTPLLNSTWDEAAQEVVLKHYVNLGIAAATPRGLVVPHVKDADRMTLPELAGAINQLVATAREGKTPPGDMSGGTFSITNIGPFGIEGGTPILNPGESGILCFGAIKRQPWVVEEQVVARDVCTLALSFDHRHIDGATGSQFLADVAAVVEDPATALLF